MHVDTSASPESPFLTRHTSALWLSGPWGLPYYCLTGQTDGNMRHLLLPHRATCRQAGGKFQARMKTLKLCVVRSVRCALWAMAPPRSLMLSGQAPGSRTVEGENQIHTHRRS